MNIIELLTLRLIHILGGIFWVGSMLFVVVFLMPTLAQLGPLAAQVTAGLERRRHLTIIPSVALLTILSGLGLMWMTSGGFAAAYFFSPHGQILTVGASATVLALILAFFIARPATIRAGRLAKETAANAEAREEVQRLRRTIARTNRTVAALLIVAATTMAVARYIH